uniref:Uncharacterized protein n=1 Tax=Schistocephalus solidus TaxID=70667 RepID=A0A0X3P6G5_SCHSO
MPKASDCALLSGSDSAACLQSPEDISRPPSVAVESSMSELTHDSASATEADDSEACGELKFRRSSPSKRRGSCQTPDGGRRKRFQHRAAVSVEASASATERTDSCASARGQPSSWHNKESGRRLSQCDRITHGSIPYKKTSRQTTRLKPSISAIDLRRNCSGGETRRKRGIRGKSMESIDQALQADRRTPYESTSTRDLHSSPLDVRLLFTLQDELCDLHRQLQAAEGTNAHRLQEAISYISQLENELQQQKLKSTKSDRSKRDEAIHRQWMKQLSASLEEMKRCQQGIAELQKILLEKESSQSPKQERKSPSIVGREREELAEIRNALHQQEREMAKLSETVNRLLTVPPVNTKVDEVEHLTTGVSTVQHSLNLDRGQAGAATHRAYGSSDVTEVARIIQPGNLCCNVAEHHNLEDYLQQLQANNEQLQQNILHKKKKLEESKVKNLQLEALVKQREEEVSQLTQELLRSKEELLQANAQTKALLSEHASNRKAKDNEKAQSSQLMQEVDKLEQSATTKKLELENIGHQLTLTSQQLVDLKSQVANFETQKREREAELRDVLKSVEEKRDLLRHTEADLSEASRRVAEAQENLRTMEQRRRTHELTISQSESIISERRLGMEQLTSKIAETKSQLESLSREVGAKSAELDLLNSRKAHDVENASKKLEDLNREFDQRKNELKAVQERLESLSVEERERLTRKTLESSEVREITVQLAQMKAELDARKSELLSLDTEKSAKMSKVNEIKDYLERENQTLHRLRTEIQAEETRMAGMKKEYICLRSQLGDLESNTKFKQKIIDDMCSTSEARLSALNTEVQRLMESSKNISEQRAAAQAELRALREQVQASNEELIRIQDRTNSATVEMGRTEVSLAERQRLNDELNRELDSLTHNLHDPQTLSICADSERMDNEALLDRVVKKIGKSKKKLHVQSEKLSSQRAECDRLDEDIRTKRLKLNQLNALYASQNRDAVDGDLLRIRLQELEEEVKQKDQELIRLTEVLQSDDRRTNQELADELERVRGQLAAAHRLRQKIKRRTGRELSQLERVAEEQCARAGLLYEELAALKKSHTFLQARVAAAEEMTDREQRLQAALAAVRCELKNCGAKAAENALEHFSVVEAMMARRSRSPLSRLFTNDCTSVAPVLMPPATEVTEKTPLRKESSVAAKDLAADEQKLGTTSLPATVSTTTITTMTSSRLALNTAKADCTYSLSPSSGVGSSPGQTATRSTTPSERRPNNPQGPSKRRMDAEWERWQIAYRDISDDMQKIRQQINSACSGRGTISSSSVDEIAVTPTENAA